MSGTDLEDVEFECRKCGKVVSFEHYELDHFCPDCDTLLRQRRQRKYWVFQFNPETYRWFDWIKENRETEQWLTSRYAREIHEGDKVAIWASGDRAGVYAIGETISNPRECPLNSEQEKYWTKKADAYKFGYRSSVTIKYSKIISEKPLLENECIKDPVLSDMTILKHRQATNFRLTKKQWIRILELIDAKH